MLLDNLKPKGKIIEIGAGSGYISFHLAKNGYDVTATDIDETAIEHMKKTSEIEGIKIRIVKSDLFENVEGEFDTVIFNPPYLPGEISTDQTIYGGENGQDVIERFLLQAFRHLRRCGSIFIILSSYNNLEYLVRKYEMYRFIQISKKNFFFHSIYVYELKKNEDPEGPC